VVGRHTRPCVHHPLLMRATVVAGMCAGADCIDDIDVVRSGRLKVLFDGVYAPSTVGTLLREFTFDHASTRDHRNRVRRPERRTAGAPADGRFRADSDWRLCVAIGHNLLRRHPGRWPARRRPGRHPTAKGRQHPRPSGPPATPAHRPPTSTLAPDARMASIVAQHNRGPRSATRLTHWTRPDQELTGKAG
jgi:hypothetical protein